MSCNVEHAIDTREPASSQFPEGSDSRRGGSGDVPIGHGNYVGQVERTPLQDISSTSNASEDGVDSDSEETGSERTTPQEVFTILDALDEQATIKDRPKLHDLLRQVREEFVSAALDERLDQSGDMKMAEMID